MKKLIIYFSHSGENYMEFGLEDIKVGNGEILVNLIKDNIDIDTFKVEEKDPYPYKYKECCDLAKFELDNNIKKEAKKFINDISIYEEIIIIGPIWWGHYPLILLNQLELLDFKNKVVKFIVTHEGSELGKIPLDIKKYCKEGNIKDGLAIRGCKVSEKVSLDRALKYINN